MTRPPQCPQAASASSYKPSTMYAIAMYFLGSLFLPSIGPAAVDHVSIPLGMNLDEGQTYGAGTVVLHEGVKMLEVPLWRSYLAGCILLGIAPCTAMVLVGGHLARGNAGHTLVMVAVNSLTIPWIAIPLFIQTKLIFAVTYLLAKVLGFTYENAAPSAMIGASNHFEVAIATAAMLMLVRFCLRTESGRI